VALPFVGVYSAGSGDDACDPDGAETLADGGAEEIRSMSSGPRKRRCRMREIERREGV